MAAVLSRRRKRRGGGNKAGAKLSSLRFKEKKANVELSLSMNMQRKKKKKFCLFPELLWNLPEGFGCADAQNQLWCFGWQVADIGTKISTSNAARLTKKTKQNPAVSTQ